MEEVIKFIAENYPEEKVAEMYDEEILNWVDSDWNEDGDYESEYDWYKDHNSNEAEDEVIKTITSDIKKNIPNIAKEIDLEDIIKDKFDFLAI